MAFVDKLNIELLLLV
uniref:Uncharacterized protein n=1 Tax=Rhizophora mucronata TaxID=61149 RepID=A0A2P2PHJ9_RHIMU